MRKGGQDDDGVKKDINRRKKNCRTTKRERTSSNSPVCIGSTRVTALGGARGKAQNLQVRDTATGGPGSPWSLQTSCWWVFSVFWSVFFLFWWVVLSLLVVVEDEDEEDEDIVDFIGFDVFSLCVSSMLL